MSVQCGGAVLCGGASRRMGADKASFVLDGVAMAVRVSSVLAAAGCDPVMAVGGDAPSLLALGLAPVADLYPGQGPLGGLITALEFTAFEHGGDHDVLFVAACDLPWLQSHVVEQIIVALDGHHVAVAHTGRIEPLCAAWSIDALPGLREAFDAGVRALHDAIGMLDAVVVPVPADALRNVNTPADLDLLR